MKKNAEIFYEQYLLGELSSDKMRELEQDEALESRLDELKRSDSEFFTRYPVKETCSSLKQKTESQSAKVLGFPRKTVRVLAPLTAVAAMFLVLFLTLPQLKNSPDGNNYHILTGDEETRIKGASQKTQTAVPSLKVYRKLNGGASEELNAGDQAGMGDRLQVSYYMPRKGYGAIFSLDGNGFLTLHYPEKNTSTTLLTAGQEIILPFAYELDDAPRFETFYLVYSHKPVSIDRISQVLLSTQNSDQLDKQFRKEFGKKNNIGVYSLSIEKR